MIIALLLAAFLLAHGAIHASFLNPRPPATPGGPSWPFELGRSWLLVPLGVGSDPTRWLGTALIAMSIAGFALAALVVMGLLGEALWPPAIVVGAVASLAVLVLFFHPWLVLGVVIDIVLLWAALIADWTPRLA